MRGRRKARRRSRNVGKAGKRAAAEGKKGNEAGVPKAGEAGDGKIGLCRVAGRIRSMGRQCRVLRVEYVEKRQSDEGRTMMKKTVAKREMQRRKPTRQCGGGRNPGEEFEASAARR